MYGAAGRWMRRRSGCVDVNNHNNNGNNNKYFKYYNSSNNNINNNNNGINNKNVWWCREVDEEEEWKEEYVKGIDKEIYFVKLPPSFHQKNFLQV